MRPCCYAFQGVACILSPYGAITEKPPALPGDVYSNEKEKPKMQNQICCETCAYYTYDEEWECYVCEQNLDEDEYVRLVEGHYRNCPYYRDGDCYKIARKQ